MRLSRLEGTPPIGGSSSLGGTFSLVLCFSFRIFKSLNERKPEVTIIANSNNTKNDFLKTRELTSNYTTELSIIYSLFKSHNNMKIRAPKGINRLL